MQTQSILCTMTMSLGKTASGLLGRMKAQGYQRILCTLHKLWVRSTFLPCKCSSAHVYSVGLLDMPHMFLVLCNVAAVGVLECSLHQPLLETIHTEPQWHIAGCIR